MIAIMTLGSIANNMKGETQVWNLAAVGCSLRETLVAAQEQGRLTCGVYEAGKLLEKDPCGVMLCLLAENAQRDVTLQIHSTLIQAYCCENDIFLIKVDSSEKLSELLSGEPRRPVADNDETCMRDTDDFNCILVQFPVEESTEAEEDVMEFCKVTADINPLPVVQLDV